MTAWPRWPGISARWAGLDKCVHSYNEAVGSLETRVLTAARRFRELGVSSKEDLPVLQPSEKISRELQAPELNGDKQSPDI